MRSRTTIVLLVLFFAGLGGLWWAERRGVPTRLERRDRAGRVFPDLLRTPPATVRAVEVSGGPGSSAARLVARRAGAGAWQLREPVDTPADPLLVENLVRNVLDLRKSPDAGTIEADASSYGLAPPEATIRLLGDDPTTPIATLRVGRRVGPRIYVAAGDGPGGPIEVVDAAPLAAVARPEREWRDHSLFRLPSFRVAGLKVEEAEPARVVALARDERRWRMTEPLATPADADRVEGLVAELSALHVADDAEGFVADDVADLAPYGLDAPAFVFTMTPFKDGGPSQSVRIGKPVPDHPGQRYAVRGGQDDVVRVDVGPLLEGYRDPNWLRSRQVADITPGRVYRAAVESQGRTFDLVRTAAGWRRWKPSDAPADPLEVQKLLTALVHAESSEFLNPDAVPDPGLDPPLHRIRVWQAEPGADPPPVEDAGHPRLYLLLGRHDPIRKTIYGRLAGDTTILALPESLVGLLPRDEFAYRDLTILSFNPAEVDRITVERPGRSVTVQAPGSGTRSTSWRMVEPVEAPADEQAVTTLLVSLSSLRAESWESETLADPAAFGLDRPGLRVRWSTRDDRRDAPPSRPRVLRIGRAKPGANRFYANVEGEPAVFAIGAGDVAALDAELHDRRVLRFDPEQARRVVLRWPGRTIAFGRAADAGRGPSWKVEPGYDPSGFDASRVHDLVKALATLQTTRFLQYGGPIAAAYGFSPPRLTIEVRVGDEPEPRTLHIGSALSATQSAATTGDVDEGATFVLATAEAWARLLRAPSRLGELPEDVFAPVESPP